MRRRQKTISAIVGYAFLLNFLLATLMGARAMAAETDSAAALLTASLCSPGPAHKPGDPFAPAKTGQDCPLCGTACPMGRCAPLPAAPAVQAVSLPVISLADDIDYPAESATPLCRSLYPSDQVSQAPPATA